jgi:hypothetical protein
VKGGEGGGGLTLVVTAAVGYAVVYRDVCLHGLSCVSLLPGVVFFC